MDERGNRVQLEKGMEKGREKEYKALIQIIKRFSCGWTITRESKDKIESMNLVEGSAISRKGHKILAFKICKQENRNILQILRDSCLPIIMSSNATRRK